MEDKKVSKYQLIESYIVEGIQSNHYKVNDILPTEAELAEKFNCSRVTVRQALSNLAYKGIIYRIQGKGSFVSKENTLKRSPLLKSFTEDILDMGKPVKIYDLAQTMIKLSNSDVGIDVVGLRPGEKLFEELLYDVNSAIKTENKKIFITKIEDGEVDITQFFERLWQAGQHADIDEIKDIMKKLVVSYKEVSYL
jgi:DNA-binding GntR family transcriptional regulator